MGSTLEAVPAAHARSASFVLRFVAYLHERFPLLGYGVLIASFYSSNQFLAHALVRPGEPMSYDIGSLMGVVTLLCLFFHLRVFDDFKDYADDCRYFPDRVLQRGVIRLGELRAACGVAIILQCGLGALRSAGALTAVLAALCYSLLMWKEFFCRRWLKRHFLIYASSHMLIMPFVAMVVFSFATRRYPWQAPAWYWLYAIVSFFVGFNWELSRKIRAPEQELDGVESYTKVFGTYGAAYMVLLVRVIDTALVALVGYHLGLSPWFYVSLLVLFAICFVGFLDYRFRISPRSARRMEYYAGMYIIAFDLSLAVAIAGRSGLNLALPW